ncbi:MAG: pyruvate, phosphate dikinase, partial [Candidatus Marinimicrobia bacterium CG_4_10_14_0_2_um_filter_48_9]
MKKNVYFFGDGKADGRATDKNLLGGKGANLAEMTSLGIPVPPGFTITTDVCVEYLKQDTYPQGMEQELNDALAGVEKIMGQKFGDSENPLLVSVRSGARQSMPGMMETVLNVGLTSGTIPGLIKKTGNERFVYDAYRRLIMMYSDVVMEKAAGIEPPDGEGIRNQLEELMDAMKEKRDVTLDTDLTTDDLKSLVAQFKEKISDVLGKPFPDNARDQLLG